MIKGIIEKAIGKVFTDEFIEVAIAKALAADRASLLQAEGLHEQIRKLKDELEDLKTKKKTEMVEIEHLVKCKQEKQALELERKNIDLMKEFQQKEMELQRQGHEKVMGMLEQGKKDLQDVYAKIIERLPNVNMEISKGTQGRKK